MAGRFTGLKNAQVSISGKYFEGQGECDVLIKDVIEKKTFKSGPAVIVEMEILNSNDPKVPVGDKRSWVQPLKDTTIAFPNLLAFIGAALGYDGGTSEGKRYIEEKLAPDSEEILEEACDKGTFRGVKIHASYFPHTTRDKKVITRVRFSPLSKAA